ncbi:MAG: hypothetical protein ACOWWM_04865 [Desulfobacterales bacterium]
MSMEIDEKEKSVVCRALNVYLSDLRQEIVKTEKFEMKSDLHRERDVIKSVLSKC